MRAMTSLAARTVWLDQPGQLALREEPLASPGDGEILCETIVTAISPGTELAAWRGLPPLRPGVVYPRLQAPELTVSSRGIAYSACNRTAAIL